MFYPTFEDKTRIKTCPKLPDIRELTKEKIKNYGVEDIAILADIQSSINAAKASNEDISVGSISDGYHTFDELYHHRAILFASLCLTTFCYKAWKSLLHHPDEKLPMYSGMFIVGVETPYGQATYHYDIDPYWKLFDGIKEIDHAPKFDGHSPSEAIERIYKTAFDIAFKPVVRGI